MSVASSRVVVGVSCSLAGLAALRLAVSIARDTGAPLDAVRTWAFSPPWHDGTTRVWCREFAARAELSIVDAFSAALGGFPPGVTVRPVVLRGSTGQQLVGHATSDGDLLVVGGDRRASRLGRRGGPVTRYCTARAHCPVVVVPPPPLAETGLVRSMLRTLDRDLGPA